MARINYLVCKSDVDGESLCQHEYHDQIAVWILRVLLDLNTWKSSSIEHDHDIQKAIGLTEESGGDSAKLEPKKTLLPLLNQIRNQLDKRDCRPDERALNNLKWLKNLIGLNDVEIEIFLFALCITTSNPLERAAQDLGSMSKQAVTKALSVILSLPLNKVAVALSSKGNLLSSGLLTIKLSRAACDLESALVVPDGLLTILSVCSSERKELLDEFFYESSLGAGALTLRDYGHIRQDLILLKPYLLKSIKQKMAGVNVLIYGEPGTGKTELIGALARSLRANLYNVSIVDSDGSDLDGSQRIKAYQMAQRVLSQGKRSLLLFDEIEDVFPVTSIFSQKKGPGKAWFNNLLETNRVPTFWLSNDIEQIDSAYIRRFDYILELKVPPKAIRKKIFQKNIGQLNVSTNWIDQMSKDKQLAPGVVARAAKVVGHISSLNSGEVEQGVERLLGNTLQAMGRKIEKSEANITTLNYQLAALNPSQDIQQLVKGLQIFPASRLCLYGPPGTGKTAFGNYLSRALNKPLIVKRASDLLSPFVGIAEKNIAAMFEEAREEEAVLLLDEADSFLQERSNLKQSWEVTQVNELLTQMETFEGLFVCSTNLMDKLDSAVLRRFDFKIKLDYITTDQAWVLFCQSVGWNNKAAAKQAGWHQKLSAYQNLTPGDFANVLRQQRLFNRKLTPEVLLEGLGQESLFKQSSNQSREIGFHARH